MVQPGNLLSQRNNQEPTAEANFGVTHKNRTRNESTNWALKRVQP